MLDTGCRPLTAEEFDKITNSLKGEFRSRNKALFTLARYTGYRIAELLSLRVGDVYDGNVIRKSVSVSRENMKGKHIGRTLPLHHIAAEALHEWITVAGLTALEMAQHPIFPSRKGDSAITSTAAWMILQKTALQAGVDLDRLGTHSFRKLFATTMWSSPFVNRDMAKMSKLLGHTHFSSTIRYLQFVDGSLESAVLAA